MSQYRFHDNLNTAGRPSNARNPFNIINSFSNTPSLSGCSSGNNVWLPEIVYNRSDILAWLSPLDPTLRHQGIRQNRVENVGEWLLQTEEFKSWIASSARNEPDNAVLFCHGGLGVGKTFIR